MKNASENYRLALKFEAEENDWEATKAYELAIREMEHPPLECFTNLSVIYLENAVEGFSRCQVFRELHLPEENLPELFRKGRELYPESVELEFWEDYICHLYDWLGGRTVDQINPSYGKQNETLVPFFTLYERDTETYLIEAKALWELVKTGRTCKERYMCSILSTKYPWAIHPRSHL